MEPDRTGKDAPRLTFSLELQVDSLLQTVVTLGGPLHESVHQALVQGLHELMETLGIPGEPEVAITVLERPLPDGRFLTIAVEDQLLRYSDETLRSIYCWLNDSVFRADVTPSEVLAWLLRISEPGTSESNHEMVAAFFRELSVAIVKTQPSVLLGRPQLQAYLAALPAPSVKPGKWPPDQEWLLPILRQVLDLRISIADTQAVANRLAQSIERSWSDACEDLIDVLRPNAVEIHLREEYLRQLTTIDADNRAGLLAFLREGLFPELGVVYPDFRLVLDTRLGHQQFMFKLNHLTCVPQVGLGPEECLVADTPERLKALDISAVAAGNPATGLPQSITRLDHKDALETHGVTAWDQMGYLILSLAAVLRKNGGCFVHRRFTETQLQQLNSSVPALVKAAQSAVSPEKITAVLRDLAAEEVSVQNLRLILERLTDYQLRNDAGSRLVLDDTATAVESGKAETRNAAPEDDLTQLTEFVRAGMKRQISGKYSRETNTIVTYLLDHEIEESLSRSGSVASDAKSNPSLEKEQQDKTLEAIRRETSSLPPTAQLPLILTTSDVRVPLRKVIAQEFPRLFVVAYQELMPGLNVMPVARISWDTAAKA
jgi:type III secretion protein V